MKFSYEHIVITGGAGFVDSNLAVWFKSRYPEVRVTALDNLRRHGSELNLPRLRTVRGSSMSMFAIPKTCAWAIDHTTSSWSARPNHRYWPVTAMLPIM